MLIAYLLYRTSRVYTNMATRLAQPTDTGGSEPTSLPPGLLHELILALSSIRYGAIELVIHDGRVVQLEKREKVRLETDVTPPGGCQVRPRRDHGVSRARRPTGPPEATHREL
jgi:hypothetical protein